MSIWVFLSFIALALLAGRGGVAKTAAGLVFVIGLYVGVTAAGGVIRSILDHVVTLIS